MTPDASSSLPAGAAPFLPVQDRVAQQPQASTALRTVDTTLTYGELNARANQLARRLGGGPPTGGPVGICLERGAEAVVALLGVLRSGRPFLPLDPRQPAGRRRDLLDRAGASALVTRADLWGPGSCPERPVLALDREGPQLLRESTADPGVRVAPGDLAYCMYTSGSSGRPKCVEITHASLSVYPGAFNSRLAIGASDRYLHGASFAFSASLRQLFVPFSVGACVVLAGPDQLRDPAALLRLVQQEEVTVLDWVPSYLRSVCAELDRLPSVPRRRLTDNRVAILVSSGEPLSWSLAQRWRRSADFRGRLASCYGQTETAGLVAWYELPQQPPGPAPAWVPLGAALPQAQLHALDADLRPAPAGSEADLWVAGPCLARGYRGEASPAARTGPWPEAPVLLPTGDRVRVEADGGLVFAGRADGLVKVNGVRVDLAEVEEALRSHPAVEDAAALAVADGEGALRLHAFIEPGPAFDAGALRRHLREHFPDHLQPHRIARRSPLPRTLSGKADRPALRASLEAGETPSPVPSGPADLEAVVQAAWSGALGREAGEGDFFELGGDSLQAIGMLGRIAGALQLDTPLIAAFFGDPTRAGLVRVVRAGLAAGPSVPLTAGPRVPRPRDPGRT